MKDRGFLVVVVFGYAAVLYQGYMIAQSPTFKDQVQQEVSVLDNGTTVLWTKAYKDGKIVNTVMAFANTRYKTRKSCCGMWSVPALTDSVKTAHKELMIRSIK